VKLPKIGTSVAVAWDNANFHPGSAATPTSCPPRYGQSESSWATPRYIAVALSFQTDRRNTVTTVGDVISIPRSWLQDVRPLVEKTRR
jgi:hypothetical protein